MFIDHFDGRSSRLRTTEWLAAAVENVAVRIVDCERLGSDAHLTMWRNIGRDYEAELRCRSESNMVKPREGCCTQCGVR
jgi:hypothetical protein